jgi:outer membrane murein-binding lipoprotein Lpp
MIARAMGIDLEFELSASGLFRKLADSVPAYEGLRYPALKDESNPVQAKYLISNGRDLSGSIDRLKKDVDAMASSPSAKVETSPRIGHKLHRLTTMTSKTPQFHLLANGNPKPANLLLAPLEQFDLEGNLRTDGKAEAAAVGIGDRTNPGGR